MQALIDAQDLDVAAEVRVIRLGDLPSDDEIIGSPNPKMARDLAKNGTHDVEIRVAVTPSGDIFIRDGGRTVKALRKAGYDEDHGVRCAVVVLDSDDISRVFVDTLKFNNQRSSNYADEYLAASALLDRGWTERAIKEETGIDHGRLKQYVSIYSGLFSELLDAWLDGKMTWTVAKALATRPQAEQEAALDILAEEGVIKEADLRTLRHQAALAAGQGMFSDDEEGVDFEAIDFGTPVTGMLQGGKAKIWVRGKSYSVDESTLIEWLEGQ